MYKIKQLNLKLLLILCVAFVLRLYGINWDSGFHLHPDERMISMVADRIHFFDKLNPHFFNYGSLPIYLLKGVAQGIDILFSSALGVYQGLLNVGRALSILFDLGTTFLIYKIVIFLFKKKDIAFFSSFFYSVAFFAIQNSHFFTVDVLFTFLATLLLYRLLFYTKDQSFKSIFIIGVVFAALFATKFTAIIFLPIIILALLIFNSRPVTNLFCFGVSLLTFNFLFMPYAFLDFFQFVRDISLQLVMNKNAYIFPYTLQYVNTLPYWYYLKNVFLWGLGPIVSILSLVGLIQLIFNFPRTNFFEIFRGKQFLTKFLIFILFYFFYFLVIGASAVKFMRYMLPLYPFLAIMAGFGLYKISKYSNTQISQLLIIGSVLWTLLFINIYSQPNTRVAATEWILKNIPTGSSLAVEYWDDYLPIYGGDRYHFKELHLYDIPDDGQKWNRLNKQLKESNYIVIASNRLYIPLQKLADCSTYKSCYPKTAEYYQKLLNGELNFKEVAEFSVRPGIQIGSFKFEINDESADESFTVFDHPKVMIFKKL